MKILSRISLPAPWLPLLAALFFVAVDNMSFWAHFAAATENPAGADYLTNVGMFAMLVLVFTSCFSIANYRFLLKPVLIILLLVTAVVGHFMDQYGTAIDWSMIQNIADTDTRESLELLNWALIMRVACLGILPSALVWAVKVDYPRQITQFWTNAAMAGAALATTAVLLMLSFKVLAPALREHRELRYLLMPTNYIQAVHGYCKRKFSTPVVVAPLGKDARRGPLWKGAARRTVTVIVVGETARAANFSLDGYARQTNPLLSRRAGLINFKHMESCGTATAVSVPCVFSALGRDNFSDNRAQRQEGLLDVFQHADIDVLWRDNNSGCKGVCDRVRYDDVSQAVAGDPLCDGDECYDERLLRGLPELVRDAKRDLVIVLHQKGSHGPAYHLRHPPAFTAFSPECTSNELASCPGESIVNAYDNTIVYTDYFLDHAIQMLEDSAREAGVDTAMIYFSDHGESLGENNMYLHGAPYMIAPKEQTHVPFMVWLSAGYRERFHLDQDCLSARTGQRFSHDHIFHSALGMLNISTAIYNPRLDLFSACKNAG